MRLLTILFRRPTWFRWATAVSVLFLLGYSAVYLAPPARAALPKTIISLTFDDGNADQLPAEQLLKSLGLHGTFFITTSWIDNPSWLTRANLNSIAADGNEIGGHTITHPDLTTLSTSAATNEVCGGRTTLASWGFNATDFAYPFAAENSSVEQIVKNCGFASARNLGDIRSPASCSGCPFAETIPPANPYNTAAPDEVDSTWTLQNLEDLVTNAEPGGGWVQLTFHHIAVGTDPTLTIDPNLFKTFVTWLAARTANGTTSVQTVAQALGNAPVAATAPAAPTGVAATAGNASAVVSWTAPANGGSPITSYAVTPSSGGTALTPVTVTGNPPSTTATVTGLSNGTAYTFTVTATNAVGMSPPSAASAPVTPTAPTAPAPPTGVSATAGNASAVVSWTAPGNGGSPITSYAVTPSTGGTALAPVTVSGSPPATTATVTGLSNGTAYTFTVTATNAVGTSAPSAASAPVTPTAPVPGVTNGGFESGLTAWTTGGVRAPVASTTAHTGTGSALLGLASGTEPLGDSTLSQTLTMPATGTSTLSFWYQPHTADDTCTGTACRYDWMEAQVRSATGTTLASLFKLSSNSGTWTQLSTNLSAYNGQTVVLWFNVHLDGSSPADDTWMYLDDVTLTNTQTTPTAPAAPTGVTAAAGNASATVTWTAPANGGSPITSYAVTPHAGTTTLAPVTVTGNPPATTANITGLTNGTAYTFTVTATNAIGTSPASAASAAVTPTAGATAPAAPTGVTATAGNASATVTWTAPANGGSAITSYAVTPHAGTTTLAPVPVTGNPPATTANITGLTNGTAYTFTVTATNAVGTSPASAASAPVTPTGTTTSAITNGGFESGLTAWTTGGVRAPVASTTAHTGTGSALLGLASGTEPLGDSSLSQTITIPATGTTTLSFWYQPHSQEDPCTGNACPYDWMEAQVRTTTGTTLGSLFKLCNNNGTWTQLTADLTAYKGQTITLWYNVHLDGSSPADDTWMYLDDITLTNR
ncbi:fibronectin type III domain-containing protein [Arthrobacter bambusae]|uniref:Peptidoglycan/xylan/chitin deacetylase (PgdA/CDA1 family) n=2 Tax=Arthrobacter TaxID=1663 RepID=A0AAW8DCC4_9MICC|nr:fibronectin type III domain-containing protein [Arthrobacter bambusae]MDP9905360.1 peptidoglycan/xylan/chitin deacetylase (PgdA/CDA1 family) [Arthrobacter bambusae]MDQ0129162.1 peptidoglycan/xylan/chitin deacetylase (PgdA/CDA1 family) [Arthrobacter bambusae]MDQ0180492.1 peptidoglycan/xylan/chitin deacetylase (PgdA/CDA1 family) [Arthrobacter bambusae]